MANNQAKNQSKQANKALEEFREVTSREELIARHNKAAFEKMYYYLEARKITPDFNAAIEEDQQKKVADQTELENTLSNLQEASGDNVDEWIKANGDGESSLEEVLKDSE